MAAAVRMATPSTDAVSENHTGSDPVTVLVTVPSGEELPDPVDAVGLAPVAHANRP